MQSEMKYIIEIIQSNSNHIQNKILNFDDKKIVDILEDNRILLPFLNKLKQSNNFQFDSLMSKIESRIKQDYVHQIDEKTEIFSNFMNELKIDWMSHKHLFFERQRADIDVLVPANKFFYVIEKLEEDNFEKIAIEPSKIKMKKTADKSNFTIHVHEKIIWESEFINTDDVWKRSRIIQDKNISIRIPEAEDSILIECAHAFFESRLIRLSDVLQFLAVVQKYSINWETVMSRLQLYGYQSAGYLYFLALNKILDDIFSENPIPKGFLENIYSKITNEEKIISVNHGKNKILKISTILPFPISLMSSALIFISFNRSKGINEYLHSLSVISFAALRHFQVKLGFRKL